MAAITVASNLTSKLLIFPSHKNVAVAGGIGISDRRLSSLRIGSIYFGLSKTFNNQMTNHNFFSPPNHISANPIDQSAVAAFLDHTHITTLTVIAII
jgi:hypothetical protein